MEQYPPGGNVFDAFCHHRVAYLKVDDRAIFFQVFHCTLMINSAAAGSYYASVNIDIKKDLFFNIRKIINSCSRLAAYCWHKEDKQFSKGCDVLMLGLVLLLEL